MMLSSSLPMPSEQPSRFGALIRQLRDARGWTQEKLAREADITVTSVSNVERGATKPNAETVEKLAAAFGLEPGDLDPWPLGACEIPPRPPLLPSRIDRRSAVCSRYRTRTSKPCFICATSAPNSESAG